MPTTNTGPVFHPVVTPAISWWERVILAFKTSYIFRDTITGTVVIMKTWRGRWYVVDQWDACPSKP